MLYFLFCNACNIESFCFSSLRWLSPMSTIILEIASYYSCSLLILSHAITLTLFSICLSQVFTNLLAHIHASTQCYKYILVLLIRPFNSSFGTRFAMTPNLILITGFIFIQPNVHGVFYLFQIMSFYINIFFTRWIL